MQPVRIVSKITPPSYCDNGSLRSAGEFSTGNSSGYYSTEIAIHPRFEIRQYFGRAERTTMFLRLVEMLTLNALVFILAAGSGFAQTTSAPSPDQTNPPPGQTPVAPPDTSLDWLKEMTVNVYFDGYYMWNFNRPLGRVNLLRAYDVQANSASINQTDLILEKAPNVDAGRRWGYRLDLMYGQATETLQGGAQNEPRPQAYRPLFQALGTYIFPGDRFKVDFGKWASPLGPEGNYTKDQINYSRSYFFNFLPFYHMGFRTNYKVSDKISLGYSLVNGIQQAEEFNEFKSQLAQLVVTPNSNSSWTLNYYVGQEQRDLVPDLNPGIPTIPTQPGLSTTPLVPAGDGRFHVIDTYATVTINKVTLLGEADYVINRFNHNSPPQRVVGGAAYFKYQFTPKVYFGQRYVRFDDVAGLFSGTAQNLNDLTSTIGFRPAEGFEARFEYRRDFSNVPFFFGRFPGDLLKAQDTLTVGLLWWFGGKQGSY